MSLLSWSPTTEPEEALREQPGPAVAELRRGVAGGGARFCQGDRRVDEGGAGRVQRRLLRHQHAGTLPVSQSSA